MRVSRRRRRPPTAARLNARSFTQPKINQHPQKNPGLDDLELHHIVVNDWARGVDAPQNVVLASIASVIEPDAAPPGRHCLHAYYPATEPYEPWAELDPHRFVVLFVCCCVCDHPFSTL